MIDIELAQIFTRRSSMKCVYARGLRLEDNIVPVFPKRTIVLRAYFYLFSNIPSRPTSFDHRFQSVDQEARYLVCS